MKTNKTWSICVYTCTIYTYMHHHIPTKMIYLVGLPSVLYERPGQNERPVLNQMFLLFYSCFFSPLHVLFIKSTTFHTKSATFHENKQDQVNMCVYIYHQISPKYNIYLVGLPSVLYELPGQNERPVLNQTFCCFLDVFNAFHIIFMKSATFHTKSGNFYENK